MKSKLEEQLYDALVEAKRTIKIWHGDDAWPIYDNNSPEMKKINNALEAYHN